MLLREVTSQTIGERHPFARKMNNASQRRRAMTRHVEFWIEHGRRLPAETSV
jgi:hypothetical protein